MLVFGIVAFCRLSGFWCLCVDCADCLVGVLSIVLGLSCAVVVYRFRLFLCCVVALLAVLLLILHYYTDVFGWCFALCWILLRLVLVGLLCSLDALLICGWAVSGWFAVVAFGCWVECSRLVGFGLYGVVVSLA